VNKAREVVELEGMRLDVAGEIDSKASDLNVVETRVAQTGFLNDCTQETELQADRV